MKNSIKNIVTFILAFGICLIIIELFLQVSEIDSLSVTQNNELLGSSLKPNRKLIFFNEGFYLGGTNNYGYYGPSYPPSKGKDVVRIALVGDSYVEAHQLFDRNSFRSLIEKKLSAEWNKKVEVLNFGMSGFNLNDDYCYYQNFVKRFKPDITLIFVSNEDFDSKRTSLRRPYCILINDSLAINYDFRNTNEFKYRQKTAYFRGKSIILGWVFRAKDLVSRGYMPSIIFDKFYNWFSKDTNKKTESKSTIQNVKLNKVTKHIIAKLARENNCIFVSKQPLSKNILKILKTTNAPLAPLIQLDSLDNKKYHYWGATKKYGHWNFQGHQKVADKISNFLCSKYKRQ